MKSITLIGKRVFAIATFAWCATTVFAQEQIWNFNAEEVADYAAFFKQPSAIEGKCNAEAMGIDINREGFLNGPLFYLKAESVFPVRILCYVSITQYSFLSGYGI